MIASAHGVAHTPSMFHLSMDALLGAAAREGVSVYRSRLHVTRGVWVPARHSVWIDSRLCDDDAAPVLSHELHHVRRGDMSCDPSGATDRLIDERVAREFIDPKAYARAERVRGPAAGCIADELNLPVWLVEAYQRSLLREGWKRPA